MDFRFIYEVDFMRLIPAVEIDARASNPIIANQIGSVIKQYTDSIVDTVETNTLVYKIETLYGNLAGYFTLVINNGSATVGRVVLRSGFNNFVTTISAKITTFINGGQWKTDYLF